MDSHQHTPLPPQHDKLINNTIKNFFDENHLFDLLNRQVLFKNKSSKAKSSKLVNIEHNASNIEASIAAVKKANEAVAAKIASNDASKHSSASKEKEVEQSQTTTSLPSSSSSSTSSNLSINNSESALTSLDKKLLKKKIMSNIGKIKIEDYVSVSVCLSVHISIEMAFFCKKFCILSKKIISIYRK